MLVKLPFPVNGSAPSRLSTQSFLSRYKNCTQHHDHLHSVALSTRLTYHDIDWAPPFVDPPPKSSESPADFATRRDQKTLTKADFSEFLAFLPDDKTPNALLDLKPISTAKIAHEAGSPCILYKFSDKDAETILQRYYSPEEDGT